MRTCPVCGAYVSRVFENRNKRWFAGQYTCRRCGLLAISGSIARDGAEKIRSWLPACPEHGLLRVYSCNLDHTEFARGLCTRRFYLRNNSTVTTRRPALEPDWKTGGFKLAAVGT